MRLSRKTVGPQLRPMLVTPRSATTSSGKRCKSLSNRLPAGQCLRSAGRARHQQRLGYEAIPEVNVQRSRLIIGRMIKAGAAAAAIRVYSMAKEGIKLLGTDLQQQCNGEIACRKLDVVVRCFCFCWWLFSSLRRLHFAAGRNTVVIFCLQGGRDGNGAFRFHVLGGSLLVQGR